MSEGLALTICVAVPLAILGIFVLVMLWFDRDVS